MSDHDQTFFDTFALILGILIAFTVAIYFLARAITSSVMPDIDAGEATIQAVIEERLAPVGKVAVAGLNTTLQEAAAATVKEAGPGPAPAAQITEPQASMAGTMGRAVAAVSAEPAAAGKSGEEVYTGACALCHAQAIAGAPKFADPAAWTARIEKGLDLLTRHAIEGFSGESGVMPAKGGRVDLSDDEVAAAVKFMVEAAQ